ncbi:conserved hypothetical protein [Theileria equi strain WA]|uniref:Ribosomal protein S18 n=1 Tax=Theileria equi strain WA TaxID=1537102 RepID=L1LEC7_THEEQ|nr:conserved hypothetical protein [Theileria equi strain WA]EKX73701.1 conserved hypothetical protein [Theileria equi strain WA]|eukprot:XP_004833153.1 conserved hypothetical protein [Theileria equi strain WA]
MAHRLLICSHFCDIYRNSRHFATKVPANSKRNTLSKTFDRLFRSFGDTQNQKISKEGGFDALYQECMSQIYKNRAEADGYTEETTESPEIADLTEKELQITRSIFKRVDPLKKLIPRLENKDDYIDPYWDPFQKLDNLKTQVASEFNDLARLVSSSEVRKHKRMVKEAARQYEKLYDPYSEYNHKHVVDDEVKVKETSEKFWDPDVDRRLVLRNNLRPFCWRDLHVLHNFVAENGQVMPRRLTFATRKQQRQIFRAIRIARHMALFPYDWRPRYRDRIPLMDPRQYLADELFHRYSKLGDLRAKAMINVLMSRYPDVNFFRFVHSPILSVYRYLRYEAQKCEDYTRSQGQQTNEFAQILNEYRAQIDTH